MRTNLLYTKDYVSLYHQDKQQDKSKKEKMKELNEDHLFEDGYLTVVRH